MTIDSKIKPLKPGTPIPVLFSVNNSYDDITLQDKIDCLQNVLEHVSDTSQMHNDELEICRLIAIKIVKLMNKEDFINLGILVPDPKGAFNYHSIY